MYLAKSDAEAVRWWMEYGRSDDYLTDTGEPMAKVAEDLDLDEDHVTDAEAAAWERAREIPND